MSQELPRDEVVRQEVSRRMGKVRYRKDGAVVAEEVELTVTETYYASGRKDVAVEVPRVFSKSKRGKGE